MAVKKYAKNGNTCRVTFELPKEVAADTVSVCGDFNEWDPAAHVMKRGKDGSFKIALTLPVGTSYRYRYLLDGERWENDWLADGYAPNPYGSDDSVLEV